MIEFVKGKLVQATPVKAVVDVGGLGYMLWIPLSCFPKLPQVGKEIFLYTSLIVREDAHTLYGFLTAAERDLFLRLIDVSGIGPKTALALIGHMDASALQLAISKSNVSLLCRIPGIGKKTAERLIVELRDKMQKGAIETPLGGDIAGDAVSALLHLGYNALHAQNAVKQSLEELGENPPLSSLVTAALKRFSKL